MKNKLPLKLHLYSYRFVLVYYLIISLLMLLAYTIFNYDAKYFLVSLISTSILFSLFLGIYEYRIVSHGYMSVQINRNNFYISSLILAFIDGIIICITNILILYLSSLINNVLNHPGFNYIVNNIATYVYLWLIYVLCFFIGNFYYIYIGKLSLFKSIFLIVTGLGLLFFSKTIISFTIKNVLLIFSQSTFNIIFLIILLVSSFIINMINLLGINKI